MKRFLMVLATALTMALGNTVDACAQANLEKMADYPSGYLQALMPYHYGTINGVLYVFSGTEPFILVRYPQADPAASFTVPNTVQRIARGAFKGCRNLEEVILPPSVFYIGEDAFDDSEIKSFKVLGNDLSEVNSHKAYPEHTSGFYDLAGNALTSPSSGVNILVNDGKSSKVMVRGH